METNIQRAQQRLAGLIGDLAPIVIEATPRIGTDTQIDEDGTLHIGHRLDIAPQAYDYTIYPKCSEFVLEKPFKHYKKELPETYGKILRSMNGLRAKSMDLFAVSFVSGGRHAFDIEAANGPAGWINEYPKVDANLLHFGGRDYGDDDLLGYFMARNGEVFARLRSSGKQVGHWPDFASFFEAELPRAVSKKPLVLPPQEPVKAKPKLPLNLKELSPLERKLWTKCPHFAEIAASRIQSCLSLSTEPALENDIAIGATKMGGFPDLPGNAVWPSKPKGGKPLSFIAQLDLAQLKAREIEPALPDSGLLSFFYDVDGLPGGLSRDESGGWRVLYFPANTNLTRRLDMKPDILLNACSVKAKRGLSLPSEMDGVFNGLDAPENQREAYCEIVASLLESGGGAHQFLGHESPIQHPVCEETVQAISSCYESEKFNCKKWEKVKDQVRDWRLLLQIGSDDDLGIVWGDMGTIYFTIKYKELATGRFEDAWLIFQCS